MLPENRKPWRAHFSDPAASISAFLSPRRSCKWNPETFWNLSPVIPGALSGRSQLFVEFYTNWIENLKFPGILTTYLRCKTKLLWFCITLRKRRNNSNVKLKIPKKNKIPNCIFALNFLPVLDMGTRVAPNTCLYHTLPRWNSSYAVSVRESSFIFEIWSKFD